MVNEPAAPGAPRAAAPYTAPAGDRAPVAGDAPPRRVAVAVTALRVTVALLLFLHGAAHWSLGIVDDFGVVLDGWGFPMGTALAWLVTLVELGGGLALAAGWLVRPLALWFALQLAAGIALVHAPAGWFVVGAGRNGMEYSVLLIVCLGVIATTAPDGYRVRGSSR